MTKRRSCIIGVRRARDLRPNAGAASEQIVNCGEDLESDNILRRSLLCGGMISRPSEYHQKECLMTASQPFASHIAAAIDNLREFGEFHGICCEVCPTLKAAIEQLAEYPQGITVRLRRDFDPSAFGPRGRPDLIFRAQLEEIISLFEFINLAHAYKLRAIAEDIVDGFSRRRLLAVVSSVRSLMENVASIVHSAGKDADALTTVCQFSPKQLSDSVKAANRNKMTGQIMKGLLDAQTALRKKVQLRRSNLPKISGDKEMPDPRIVQTSVQTMIKKLKFAIVFRDMQPLDYYDALCETVHPNSLSAFMFTDTTAIDRSGVQTIRLTAMPNDWTVTAAVLELTAVPIVASLPLALRTLDAEFVRLEVLKQLRRGFLAYTQTSG